MVGIILIDAGPFSAVRVPKVARLVETVAVSAIMIAITERVG